MNKKISLIRALFVVWCVCPIISAQTEPPVQTPPPTQLIDVLTLDTATETFLQRNLTLEAARLQINVAAAQKIAARLRPRPILSVTAENLRVSGGQQSFNQLYEVGATVAQPLELGGQRRLRRELAERTVSVAEAELATVLRGRLFEFRRAFYQALLARELLALAADNRDGFAELLRLTIVRFNEGDVSEGELIKVRLERIKFDTAVANAALNLRQSKIRLLELLGEGDFARTETLDVRGVLEFRERPLDLASLREAALVNRPDVKLAEAEIARAEAVFRLERVRGSGELVPFAGYRRVGDSNTLVAGVSVPLPFGNRNQGEIARAEAELRVGQANVRAVRNRTLAEVETAYQASETARELVLAYQMGVLKQADESGEIQLIAYREGAVELITLLDAQRTRTEVRENYYRALLNYYTGLLELERATGTELTK